MSYDKPSFEPEFVNEPRASYGSLVRSHRYLRVYQRAFGFAHDIYLISKAFPAEERFELTSQIRRSSRSVCANIAEAWRKRRYKPAFISKMSDSETEAGETQTWLEFAKVEEFMTPEEAERLWQEYESLIATIVGISLNADKWVMKA